MLSLGRPSLHQHDEVFNITVNMDRRCAKRFVRQALRALYGRPEYMLLEMEGRESATAYNACEAIQCPKYIMLARSATFSLVQKKQGALYTYPNINEMCKPIMGLELAGCRGTTHARWGGGAYGLIQTRIQALSRSTLDIHTRMNTGSDPIIWCRRSGSVHPN